MRGSKSKTGLLPRGTDHACHICVVKRCFHRAGPCRLRSACCPSIGHESLGVPGFFAYLTMAAEIAGGTLLLLGIETRWVALLLIPFITGTIVLVHGKKTAGCFPTRTVAGSIRRSGSSGSWFSRRLATERPRSARRSGVRKSISGQMLPIDNDMQTTGG